MIGIVEIIFSLIMFCALWFIIFKFMLKYASKKILKDIVEKMEKQNKKFYTDGKEVNLKEKLGLDKKEETPNIEVEAPGFKMNTEIKEESINKAPSPMSEEEKERAE